jgi:hypothetical protein
MFHNEIFQTHWSQGTTPEVGEVLPEEATSEVDTVAEAVASEDLEDLPREVVISKPIQNLSILCINCQVLSCLSCSI